MSMSKLEYSDVIWLANDENAMPIQNRCRIKLWKNVTNQTKW